MIKYFLLVFTFVVPFLSASSQAPRYWRLKNKGWPFRVNFYWDWHGGPDYKVPAGVLKETIYHQKINSRDSALEQVTWFNKQGLPIIDTVYAAPSGEGWLYLDSFCYNSHNQLIKTIRRHQEIWHPDSVVIEYDSLQREISRIDKHTAADLTETVYDSNRVIKTTRYSLNKVAFKTEIYFYSHGREDSMQLFKGENEWLNTKIFRYDSVQLIKETYITYKKVRRHNQYTTREYLKWREEYNADGTTKVYLTRYLLNFNYSRNRHVESHITYNSNKSVKECLFFVMGRKVFIKKHYYKYY